MRTACSHLSYSVGLFLTRGLLIALGRCLLRGGPDRAEDVAHTQRARSHGPLVEFDPRSILHRFKGSALTSGEACYVWLVRTTLRSPYILNWPAPCPAIRGFPTT